MLESLRRAVLSAAVAAGVMGLPSFTRAEPEHRDAGSPHPTQPSQPENAAQVPVKEVVLFSSGVGYFEHFGSVKGDATTELRFKTEQINDILKSLVLQDMEDRKSTRLN